jgi:glucosylceramidase
MNHQNFGSFLIASLLVLSGIHSITNADQVPINPNSIHAATVWMTTADQQKKLESQGKVNFSAVATPDCDYTIKINENIRYQQMDGFGASLTDASAWLIFNKLDPSARQRLMNQLFDTQDGIGLSFLRQPMGASDFAKRIYSYDDQPFGQTDPSLASFSIGHDQAYLIPLIKDAIAINPALKVMATPWSPPGWMKNTGFMIGKTHNTLSYLLKEYYDAYADYFVKFIRAYEAEGIPIYAVTVQNEPHNAPDRYPGMYMSDKEQSDFIENHLGPAFARHQLQTKIICWDHNFDNTKFAINVLNADQKSNFVAGSAWHFYGGTHEAMTKVHQLFPDKGLWFTEGSGGYWGAGSTWKGAFMDQMWHVIRIPRHWGRSILWWNMALDQNNGPSLLAKSDCRGVVTINQSTGKVTYNADYYSLGQISKFVMPGAFRIDSNTYDNELEDVAFKNPDGSKVLIVSNRTASPKTFKVVWGSSSFLYTMPGEAAVTFKW